MKWLTKKYIKTQGRKSLLAALKCSLKHHQQIVGAMPREFREAIRTDKADIYVDHCALCYRYHLGYNTCGKCPLRPVLDVDTACCPEWRDVANTYKYWLDNNTQYKSFIEAEQKLIARIELEIKKRSKKHGKN